MALIICPECGKEISDKAGNCPNCGCPISTLENVEELSKKKKEELEQSRSEKQKTTIGVIIAIIVAVIIVGVVYYNATSLDRARAKLRKTNSELEELQLQYELNQYLIDSYEND